MTTRPSTPEDFRRLAEVARVRSAELDLLAGQARVEGDDATSRRHADKSAFAWGVSRTLTWLAGDEGDEDGYLAQTLND